MLEDSDGEGIWVSPDEFVAFSEPQKSLTAQIASRSRAIDFTDWACICPILIPFSRLRDGISVSTANCAPTRWLGLYPQT